MEVGFLVMNMNNQNPHYFEKEWVVRKMDDNYIYVQKGNAIHRYTIETFEDVVERVYRDMKEKVRDNMTNYPAIDVVCDRNDDKHLQMNCIYMDGNRITEYIDSHQLYNIILDMFETGGENVDFITEVARD